MGQGAWLQKNIGPYEIWGGNPAKMIKKRFCNTDIQKLLDIKWWDWDIETIKKNLPLIRRANVHDLWKKIKKETT